MTLRIANTDFDRVSYDADADVLYLAAGDPARAVEFDETPEGHALRFDADGALVGITIVNARALIDQDGLDPDHAAGDDLCGRHRPGTRRGVITSSDAGPRPPARCGVRVNLRWLSPAFGKRYCVETCRSSRSTRTQSGC